MLPDLELGEVEAERLGLPHQVLDLAVGHLGRAGFGQGVADDTNVVDQVARRAIGEGLLTQTRGANPPRHGEEELAVRLRRRASQPAAQRTRRRRRRGVDRQRPADAIRDRLQREERVL